MCPVLQHLIPPLSRRPGPAVWDAGEHLQYLRASPPRTPQEASDRDNGPATAVEHGHRPGQGMTCQRSWSKPSQSGPTLFAEISNQGRCQILISEDTMTVSDFFNNLWWFEMQC